MAIKINNTTVIDDNNRVLGVSKITYADATEQVTAGGASLGTTIRAGGELIHTLDNPNAYSSSSNDGFGYAVAISGNYAVVGTGGEADAAGTNSGKVYVFDVIAGTLLHTLNNPNAYSTSSGDYFGRSVDISGNCAIVGAYQEDDITGTQSGKAYIFDVVTGVLLHTLDNPNAYSTSSNDNFGFSVAISGNYAIVGTPSEDEAGNPTAGKVYIFDVRTGTLLHTLDDPNVYSTSSGDQFGWSVDISGNYAIIGANNEDDAGGIVSGKAYIYDVTTGTLLHTLDDPNAYSTSYYDNFGKSVSISGNYAIAGAYSEDDPSGSESGKAYIFDVRTGTLLHTLDNPNAYSTGTADQFGASVAIGSSYAVVTARYEDQADGSAAGTAYIFDVRTGALLYSINNPSGYSTAANDEFAYPVAISGNYVIAGAAKEDDAGGGLSGKAYIFAAADTIQIESVRAINFAEGTTFDSSHNIFGIAHTAGEVVHTISNPNVYGLPNADQFGYGVASYGDYIAVFAAGEETEGSPTNDGVVYVFNTNSGTLLYTLQRPTPDASNEGRFGNSIKLNDKYLLISAPYETTGAGINAGAAYVYDVTTGALLHTIASPDLDGSPNYDNFGWVSAISGKYGALSTYTEFSSSGCVHVYDLEAGTLLHTLYNPSTYSTGTGDFFGASIAMYGTKIAVGATTEDDAGGTTSGVVYIFDLITGTLLNTILNPNAYSTSANDRFGYSLDMYENYLVASAVDEDDAGGGEAGRVYVFDVTHGTLVYTLDNPATGNLFNSWRFGLSVAINDKYIAVGTPQYNNPGASSGILTVYSLATGQQILTLSDPNAFSTDLYDYFARSIALNGDFIVAGADGEDELYAIGGYTYTGSGKVYVFSLKEQTYFDKLTTIAMSL